MDRFLDNDSMGVDDISGAQADYGAARLGSNEPLAHKSTFRAINNPAPDAPGLEQPLGRNNYGERPQAAPA